MTEPIQVDCIHDRLYVQSVMQDGRRVYACMEGCPGVIYVDVVDSVEQPEVSAVPERELVQVG